MDYALSMRDRQNIASQIGDNVLEDLQLEGQRLYRQKQYEDALQCFNKAIEKDAKAPLTVRDNRAATYIKLGNLRAALQDGKEMIQQEKTNCMGYLRAAKVLQLLNQYDAALDIYHLGIRKVSSGDENIKLLKSLCDKLARQLAPKHAIDPLEVLPLELVEVVIRSLRFTERINLLRVSKSWRGLLASMPAIWVDLDFSSAKRPVALNTIRAYIKRSNGNLTRLSIDRFGQNQDKILCYVADRCPKLEELSIPQGFVGSSLLKAAPSLLNLRKLILSSRCEITLDTVNRVLNICKILEHAEFPKVAHDAYSSLQLTADLPKLQLLEISSIHEGRIDGLSSFDTTSFIPRLTGIRTITLRNWALDTRREPDLTMLSRVESLDISGCLTAPPRVPPSIRNLCMRSCFLPMRAHFPMTPDPCMNLPNLRRLSIAHTAETRLFAELYSWLSWSKGQLQQLDISARSDFEYSDLITLVEEGFFESMEELNLSQCKVRDQFAVLLASRAPCLRSLDLSYTAVTGVGIKALITQLKGTLNILTLNHCERVSPDAVELARSMGVATSYGFREETKKGKKVRHG